MLWLVIVSLIWGLSFGLIGNSLAGLPSSYVTVLRLLLCLAVFLPFMRRVNRRNALGLCAIGAVQFGFMYLLYIESFTSLKSYEVALFTTLTPVYVTLLGDCLARRFRIRHLAASVLAVAGALVILAQNGAPGQVVWKGFLILQASNICFAAGQLAYARWNTPFEGRTEHSVFGWMYLGAVLVTLPFVGPDAWTQGLARTTSVQWGILLYLGVVASGLCFFLWNHGAKQVSAARLAVMNNLKIPFAAFFSIVLFREQADAFSLVVGALLIALSMCLSRKETGGS